MKVHWSISTAKDFQTLVGGRDSIGSQRQGTLQTQTGPFFRTRTAGDHQPRDWSVHGYQASLRGGQAHHGHGPCRQKPKLPLGRVSRSIAGMDAHTHGFYSFELQFGFANPTLADQYLFLDVGLSARWQLERRPRPRDGLQFHRYRNSSLGSNIGFNLDTLVYFDIAPLQPEQVRTVEAGYRTTLGEKLCLDANYYDWYTNFIGYNLGLDLLFENPSFPEFITGVDCTLCRQQFEPSPNPGASLGFNYFPRRQLHPQRQLQLEQVGEDGRGRPHHFRL